MRPASSILLLFAALAALVIGASPAGAAFTAVRVDPGGDTLDLGAAPVSRLLFGTFRSSSDTVRARFVVPGGEKVHLELLVPAKQPEKSADQRTLPTVDVRLVPSAGGTPATNDRPAAGFELRANGDPSSRTEPSTGLPFLAVDTLDIDGAPGARTFEATITGGSAARRAALLVGDGSRFGLRDAQHTPHAVGQLLGWYDVPVAAPGSGDGTDENAVAKRAIAPAVLALAMLAIAVWWLRSGRATARRRGRERLG